MLQAARWLLPLVLTLAHAAAAQPQKQTPPVAVYGIEHEVRGARERVLVSAGEKLDARLEEKAGSVVLVLPGAVLDDSAPRRIDPRGDARVRRIRAEERFTTKVPEVRITIARKGEAAPELIQRGAILTVEFGRRGRAGAGNAGQDGIVIQYKDAPLTQVVEDVARAVGETWIFDDSLTGNITVVATDRVSREEAVGLLHAALRLGGHAALPNPGGGYRVTKIANAVPLAPFRPGGPAGRGDRPVATLRRLHAASAEQLVRKLDPWLGASAVALAEPRSNVMILAGPESQVHNLLTIVDALDEAADTSLWVRRVRNADAEQAASLLRETFANAPPGRGLEVWADERTGLLIARGAPATLDEARQRLDRIDVESSGFGYFEVRKLVHADPEDLQRILQGLGTQGSEGPGVQGSAGLQPGSFAVAVDGPTHSLVIRAEPSVQARLAEVIDALDVAPPRIHVEAMVLEIVASEALSLGIDALMPFGDQQSSKYGGFVLLDPTGGGLVQPGSGANSALGVRISRKPTAIPITGPGGEVETLLIPRETLIITANESVVKTQVLQRPNLLVLSGDEHEIFAGDEVPIPVSNTVANVGVPSTSVDLQRENVGVRMRVRPTLGQAGRVNMEVDIETSRVRTAATLVSGDQGAVIQKRAVTTTIVLEDDETALVGMGTLGDVQELEIGTPWLKDIPALGWLFKRRDTTRVKTHLVVTLQARVQRGPESELAESIRRRIGVERALSRVKTLERGPEPRWALRVATLTEFEDAADVAAHFERLGERAEIVSWAWHESPRHDVLLDGFESLGEASQAALRARDEGFAAELVPVPARAP